MAYDNKTIGLALSGGGFRAALFGLGSLWRLNDSGLLHALDRVTAVSGGAILAGLLASRWPNLTFTNGVCQNFETEIVRPMREFCSKNVDAPSVIKGWLTPFRSTGDVLTARYDKDLFHARTIRDLPRTPAFILYATNMQTGRNFRFTRDYIADWHLGINDKAVVPLARAVAASSAFPPVFSPVTLETDPSDWREPGTSRRNLDALRRKIVLCDGGVYDNMGLEALLENMQIILVSDGGSPFAVDESPGANAVSQLGRVRDILIDQTRALRKRWLLDDFKGGRTEGTYWGVGTRIEDYQVGVVAPDSPITAALSALRTRLHKFTDTEQGQLINWGYALCDAAIRRYVFPALPAASRCPVAEHPLHV